MDVKEKYLRPGALTSADLSAQKFATYFEKLPEDVDYADCFDPAFWRHHKKLRQYDVVRLARVDGDFDIFVTVRRVVAGGVVVDFFGGRPPLGIDPYEIAEVALGTAMKVRVAPIGPEGRPVIRIEHTNKTQWRVLGLNNQEVVRDITSRDLALVELANYLDSIRMRNPTEEELGANAAAKMRAASEKAAAQKVSAA